MSRFKLLENTDWQALTILVAISILVAALWNTWLVYPLKMLVVFFHELSHGVAAVVTGGSIVRIGMVAQEGGVCVTLGGNRFLVLTAGYLGSLVWGGVILVLAARTRLDRGISVALGAILLLVTLLYVRPIGGFGFVFGALSGGALVALGAYLPEAANDYVLRIVGLTSCLYAVLDIKSDIIDRPHLRSDAVMLAEHTGLPALIWGILWISLAVIGALFFLLYACKAAPAEEGSEDV